MRNEQDNMLWSHLVAAAAPAALAHHSDVLPAEAALPGGEAALAEGQVEEGGEGHENLQPARDGGHLGEAVQVRQQTRARAGHEPPRPGQRAPHASDQTLHKIL